MDTDKEEVRAYDILFILSQYKFTYMIAAQM